MSLRPLAVWGPETYARVEQQRSAEPRSDSLELVHRLAPSVPVRDLERYTRDPWRALFDRSAVEAVPDWRPRYRWPDRGQST